MKTETATKAIRATEYALEDLDISPAVLGVLAEMEASRGDPRGMSDEQRSAYVTSMCEALRLNPLTRPVQFLLLQGREVLYLTRTATDQLAAMHNLNRETMDGPEVRTIEGTKVVYCRVRCTLPSGRFETAVATVPLRSPCDDLMKAETKAKRRGTLAILGVGVLCEDEAEAIPGGTRVPTPPAGARQAPATLPASESDPEGARHVPESARHEAHAEAVADLEREAIRTEHEPQQPETPAALEGFYARIAEIELPGEAVTVWMKHRAELAALSAPQREDAWKALCKRTEEVGKMKNAKVWLKKAIAEEDARRSVEGSGHGGA